jgi:hypothetical protein
MAGMAIGGRARSEHIIHFTTQEVGYTRYAQPPHTRTCWPQRSAARTPPRQRSGKIGRVAWARNRHEDEPGGRHTLVRPQACGTCPNGLHGKWPVTAHPPHMPRLSSGGPTGESRPAAHIKHGTRYMLFMLRGSLPTKVEALRLATL